MKVLLIASPLHAVPASPVSLSLSFLPENEVPLLHRTQSRNKNTVNYSRKGAGLANYKPLRRDLLSPICPQIPILLTNIGKDTEKVDQLYTVSGDLNGTGLWKLVL